MPGFSFLRLRHWRRYRQILRTLTRHGFGFFLEAVGLRPFPLPWRREPPPTPPAQYLRLALEELGPTFIKLGQVLSTRPDLVPPAFVSELVLLQDRVPPFPFEQARAQIEAELGSAPEELFSALDETPLAAASLSQVHAARLPSGEEVVLKIQRPGIEEQIATDLEILRELAALAEGRIALARLYDLSGIVEEFAHTLQGELDFRREAHNADRFRHNFVGKSYIHIPSIHWDLTTHRVLTMERVRGIKIDDLDALDAAGLDRHRVAVHATEIIMQEVFEDGFFHADPHPGNFYVMPDEVIAAMDFGMVGWLSQTLRQQLLQLFVAVARLETDQIVKQILRMSLVERGVDQVGLRRDLERLLHKYAGRPLQELQAREIIDEATEVAFRRRLRLPAELWLLGKTIGMLEGVGLQLDPQLNPFDIARPYAERFLQETLSPASLLQQAGEGAKEWGTLVLDLPTVIPDLVTQLQEGDFSVGMELRQYESFLAVLDLLSVRLALGLLVATLMMASAMFLRPLLTPGVWWGWLIIGLGTGALLALLLGFLWMIRRGG